MRLNADVGSVSRSVATSKGCGCPITTPTSSGSDFVGSPPCVPDIYPYCPGPDAGGGKCTSEMLRVRLVSKEEGGGAGGGGGGGGGGGWSTEGGEWFEVEGV